MNSDDESGDEGNGDRLPEASAVVNNSISNRSMQSKQPITSLQPVPAVMEMDHEFMTQLFNLFAPLMCFSYTDCVDDIQYVAASSEGRRSKQLSSASKKDRTKKKKTTTAMNNESVPSSSSPPKASKCSEEKVEDKENVGREDMQFVDLELSNEENRELELRGYAQEAYEKGLLYFGYTQDINHPFQWELQKHSHETKVYTCQYEPQDFQYVVKSEFCVPFSVDVVLQSLVDEDFLMDLDNSLDSFEMLQANEPNMICRKYCYKSYWPISPRDFVVLTVWNKLEDGSTMVTTVSVPNEWSPVMSSHVRAYITFSGSLLKPIDDENTEITMMNHSKLETTIPVSIINSTAVGIPISFVVHFRKFLKQQESALKSAILKKS